MGTLIARCGCVRRFLLVAVTVAGCSKPGVGVVKPDDVPEEARTHLGGIYVAEKTFFGEYGTYSSDLLSLNWTPGERVGRGFVFGFCNDHPTTITGISNYDGRRRTTNEPTIVAKIGIANSRVSVLGDPCASMSPELTARFHATGQAHRAFAATNRDEDADLEIWSIDYVREYRLEAKD